MTLNEAASILKEAGIDSPLYEARQIFSEVGNIPIERLIFGAEADDDSAVCAAVKKRAERIPLEYVIGHTYFYREKYTVTPDCLIPRGDTERLVDYAVAHIPKGELFVDLCTGSGCVALSVLNNTEKTEALAVDISDAALAVARKNANDLGLSDRAGLISADALGDAVCQRCYAVLSNPPYVTEDEYPTLSEEIHKEPRIAFVGGRDGLDFYRKITQTYRSVIADDGFIAFEIGYRQAAALCDIAKSNSMSCEILTDLAGNDRVAVLRKI